jgi:hypothetical protein
MIQILRDSKDQPFVQWRPVADLRVLKRAWIQRRTDEDKDWARSGRYLNVVRVDDNRAGIGGNPTDFPIFSDAPDEQILEAFVATMCVVTGCRLP